jgi:hypothetical protein
VPTQTNSRHPFEVPIINYRHARSPLNSALPFSNDTLQIQLETTLAHQNAGEIDSAHKIYEAILRDTPHNVNALHLLGILKF